MMKSRTGRAQWCTCRIETAFWPQCHAILKTKNIEIIDIKRDGETVMFRYPLLLFRIVDRLLITSAGVERNPIYNWPLVERLAANAEIVEKERSRKAVLRQQKKHNFRLRISSPFSKNARRQRKFEQEYAQAYRREMGR